jgi:adenosylhomocysteine nucleosidase
MAQAGQTSGQPHPPRFMAPAPSAADVAIIAAMNREIADIVDRLQKVRRYSVAGGWITEGEYAGKIALVAVSGMGLDSAQACSERVVAGHKPRWVISAGFAGALDPALQRNDLVLPREVMNQEGETIPIAVPDSIASAIPRARRGRLLTVNRVITSVREKSELHHLHAADLVDMETFAIARFCRERSIRFLAARVISDDARGELPAEITRIATRTGGYRLGAAVRAIWNHPAVLKDFWKLHEHSLEAGDRLAKLIFACLAAMPE